MKKKTKKNSFTPILVLAIVTVLAGIGYFGFKNLYTRPSTSQTTIDTTNWKTFSDQTLSFQYPTNWNITRKDFLNSVLIENPRKTVRITISKGQYPYGLETMGPEKTQEINLEAMGNKYLVKETTLTNKQAIFVDFNLDPSSDYHILFGTGYPAADDTNISIDDYTASKEIIYKIIGSININQKGKN